jgi:hypothetical protein
MGAVAGSGASRGRGYVPWEPRGRKKYFYRTERVRSRPVRRYAGTGQTGELAAAADGLRRLEREIEARERRAEQARQRSGWSRSRPSRGTSSRPYSHAG